MPDSSDASVSIGTNKILTNLYKDYKKQDKNSCNLEISLNGGESIYSHKIILQAHSGYFNKCIGSDNFISIKDKKVTVAFMKVFIRYLLL
uniref:BTB domain-containing protein n=1 Tax=Parastrongyloides trichosuri TaxID=131310 RepID=A0A0N4Z0Q4_PARTI